MSQPSPFKFLDAYQRDDINEFFGRKEETDILYKKVVGSNLTLLYGASGTGKTSLVSCGLSNRFTETDWYEIFIRRGNNIIRSFWQEVKKHTEAEIETPQRTDDISKNDQAPDGKKVREILESLYFEYYVPIYLIFDQFEELFVLGSDKEQIHFFRILKIIVESKLPVKVLLILREEYLAHMSVHEKLMPYLLDNRFRLEKMNQLHLKEVISGSAQAYQIEIETKEETIERILTKLQDRQKGVDLTYLQVYLDRLYRNAVTRKNVTENKVKFDIPLVEEVGQLEDVLDAFLLEQVGQVEEELEAKTGSSKRNIALLILYALITNDDTKRALDIDAIMQSMPKGILTSKEDIKFCIDQFINRRILKPIEEA